MPFAVPFRLRGAGDAFVPYGVNMNFLTSKSVTLFSQTAMKKPHNMHPDFSHLVLLVFEAVLEVVCVSLPGYIVARMGMFDANAQKFVANLNVQLFTPCLIFTKLASQLSAEKLADLAIIPAIFLVQTAVSFVCAWGLSKAFRFNKRQSNFVKAMGVFGNSNSLPISLVISLSKTLSGLHWEKIPGDNDNEVAARGILYLLIFQQLGQLLRWSWGFNVLLKKKSEYTASELGDEVPEALTEGGERYSDSSTVDDEHERLIGVPVEDQPIPTANGRGKLTPKSARSVNYSDDESIVSTPTVRNSYTSDSGEVMPTPADGNIVGSGPGNMAGHHSALRQQSSNHINTFPKLDDSYVAPGPKRWVRNIKNRLILTSHSISNTSSRVFHSLPPVIQKVLAKIWFGISKVFEAVWASMNPPLWAMLAALVVASVPKLQAAFFTPGSFVENSVTRAIAQSGGVAVPLILVVLGANLARNTLPKEDEDNTEDPKVERNLLIASLVSRMLLPTIIMAPILAVIAKYIQVSIVDDPIFVIVCFLLTGAPSALQLAQICQLNNVYMGAMSRLLFQSYVIWILPSTLILVMLALEVVEWAA